MASLAELQGTLLAQLMPAYAALYNYEPLAQSQVCGDPAGFVNSLMPPVGEVLLLSVAIIVFLYLLSRILANPMLESYVKLELQEILITCLIFIFFGLMIPIPCVPASFLSVPPAYSSNTMILDGAVYLSEVGSNYLLLGYFFSTLMYYIISFYSVIINAAPLVGTVVAPLQGLSAVISPVFSTVATTLGTGVVINFAYLLFYDFMTYSFLKAMLPIGLLLRCFTITKKAGSAIIALCLSFYVLFPFLLTLEHSIVMNSGYGNSLNMILRNVWSTTKYVSDAIIPGPSKLEPGEELKEWIEKGANPIIYGLGTAPFLATFVFQFVAALGFMPITKLIAPAVLGQWMASIVAIPAHMIAAEMLITTSVYVFINSVIFPALNTLVLVGAAASFAQLLGVQLDVSNLTRLI
ncbi:MAG: hypothetical protein QW035_02880 [Candidatus Anstonellales archaeon]